MGMSLGPMTSNVVANLSPSKPNVVATLPVGHPQVVATLPVTSNVVPWAGGAPAKAAAPATTPTSPTAPANPNGPGSGGGSSAPAYQDKSNDIAQQNAGLAAVDQQEGAGSAAVDQAYQKIWGQYDTEAKNNQADYQSKSDTNQNNLQGNKQTALINAAQGRQGLMGTLASLGALSGDGITLANHAVQQGANEDLTGAASTYSTNQSGLDGALKKFQEDDARRRQDATTARDDAKTNVHNQALKSKQTYFSNLANDYEAEGNTDQAKAYTAKVNELFPGIASSSIPSTNLTAETAAYTPASLGSYLAGANNMTVSTSGGAPGASDMPGLVASLKRKA